MSADVGNGEVSTQHLLPRWLRLGFAALALLAIVIATVAPLAAARGHVEAVGLYMALEPLCHQRADRSWTLGDLQAGMCIRCYGIYAGIVAAALMGLPFSRKMALGGALAVGAAWAMEHVGGVHMPEMARFASGGAFGLAMASIATFAREPSPNTSETPAANPPSKH